MVYKSRVVTLHPNEFDRRVRNYMKFSKYNGKKEFISSYKEIARKFEEGKVGRNNIKYRIDSNGYIRRELRMAKNIKEGVQSTLKEWV